MLPPASAAQNGLLEQIIDGSPSIIFLKDTEGRFITINAALEKMLEISREELRGKTDYDICPKERADYYREHDRRVMEMGEPLQVEEVADLKDGHHVFLATKFPIRSEAGEVVGVCGISQDITARKQALEALSQSERVAAQAKLVAAIAHDLNNPLQAALSAVYLASLDKGASPETAKNLLIAHEAIERAAALARRTFELADQIR